MTTWARHLYEHNPLAIAKGEVNGYSVVNIFGYQPLVGTDAICVWENSEPYLHPTAAFNMTVVSTSAADNGGVAKLLISGLDAEYSAVTELVSLDGTNPVVTASAFFRINNVRIMVAGVGQEANVGTITVSNAGVTYAKVLPSIGQSQMSQYTVAEGHSFYLTRVNSFAQQNGGTGNYNTYSVVASSSVSYTVLQSPYFQTYEAVRVAPFKYAEKTSVQWRSQTETNTSSVGMIIEGYLIKNKVQGEP
jgi:hypothetical protein